jgi:sec-independent protein translocase protein TatC
VLALTRLGVVDPRQLARNRGYVVLVMAILAAVATATPEPVTVLVTMAPMVVLFEGSVLVARIFAPRERS